MMIKKILIVDDEPSVLKMLRKMLKDDAKEIIEAENGEQALELCLQHEMDLIITDIVMPKTDGMELLVKMKAKIPELYIIVMSGGNRGHGDKYLQMASDLGANALLHKPFSLSKLLETIENH